MCTLLAFAHPPTSRAVMKSAPRHSPQSCRISGVPRILGQHTAALNLERACSSCSTLAATSVSARARSASAVDRRSASAACQNAKRRTNFTRDVVQPTEAK